MSPSRTSASSPPPVFSASRGSPKARHTEARSRKSPNRPRGCTHPAAAVRADHPGRARVGGGHVVTACAACDRHLTRFRRARWGSARSAAAVPAPRAQRRPPATTTAAAPPIPRRVECWHHGSPPSRLQSQARLLLGEPHTTRPQLKTPRPRPVPARSLPLPVPRCPAPLARHSRRRCRRWRAAEPKAGARRAKVDRVWRWGRSALGAQHLPAFRRDAGAGAGGRGNQLPRANRDVRRRLLGRTPRCPGPRMSHTGHTSRHPPRRSMHAASAPGRSACSCTSTARPVSAGRKYAAPRKPRPPCRSARAWAAAPPPPSARP